ncbi:MAG: hypothetical protein DRH90_24305 [Deltaproteobacteria bacterium]|nr:MAG: hypothetical protein DRH90_24305 [Deltaproteobacteria bacterium]RLC08880.1 MAG: hypothetical protein DRI24_22675 [Deltaproteobacteria bacterium]HHE75472.1 hypothetical protein [Desulfobacteraceae bacterium]
MNPKKQILKFIQQTYEDKADPDSSKHNDGAEVDLSDREIIQELFDGMSTGTARIIIEREVSRTISEKFNISPVENKGRYYVAKIVRSDGSSMQRLLLDKQTGSVQMVGR